MNLQGACGIKRSGATMLNSSINGELPVQNGSRTIRFGVFEADLHSGEVRKSGNRVKLQDQPFKVLQILLERPGSLVTREELQSRIWPDESYGDFDHAVNVAVGKLRTALGDSADNPCFIETVPRRGYRFVATLECALVETPPAPPPTIVVPPRRRISGRKLGAAGRVPPYMWEFDWARYLVGAAYSALAGAGFSASDGPARHGLLCQVCAGWAQRDLRRLVGWRADRNILDRPENSWCAQHGNSREPAAGGFFYGRNGGAAVAHHAFMFTSLGTLAQVPLTGGSPRQIAENVLGADWAPDGKTLAIVRDMGGKQRLEFPVGHMLYETDGWISHPRISPKGDQIAFLDHTTHDDDRGVVSVVDLAGRKKVLSSGWESEKGWHGLRKVPRYGSRPRKRGCSGAFMPWTWRVTCGWLSGRPVGSRSRISLPTAGF